MLSSQHKHFEKMQPYFFSSTAPTHCKKTYAPPTHFLAVRKNKSKSCFMAMCFKQLHSLHFHFVTAFRFPQRPFTLFQLHSFQPFSTPHSNSLTLATSQSHTLLSWVEPLQFLCYIGFGGFANLPKPHCFFARLTPAKAQSLFVSVKH